MGFAGFLMDENLPQALARGLVNHDPAVEIPVLRIGETDAPGLGTPDEDILAWIDTHGFLLVTANRATMPVQLEQHLATGGSVPGILVLRPSTSLGEIIVQLAIVWEAGQPSDFLNLITYIPL